MPTSVRSAFGLIWKSSSALAVVWGGAGVARGGVRTCNSKKGLKCRSTISWFLSSIKTFLRLKCFNTSESDKNLCCKERRSENFYVHSKSRNKWELKKLFIAPRFTLWVFTGTSLKRWTTRWNWRNFWHNDTDFNLIFYRGRIQRGAKSFSVLFLRSIQLSHEKQTRKYIFRVEKLNLKLFLLLSPFFGSEMKIDNR